MRLAPILLSLFALSACTTPQDRCIRQSTEELRRVTSLLADVEANLARGYAWQEYEVTSPQWEICGWDEVKKGDKIINRPRHCFKDHTETRRRTVPIDPLVETRKRDNLAAKRKQLAAQAQARIAQCRAMYPQES